MCLARALIRSDRGQRVVEKRGLGGKTGSCSSFLFPLRGKAHFLHVKVQQYSPQQVHRPVANPGIGLAVGPAEGKAYDFSAVRSGATDPGLAALI